MLAIAFLNPLLLIGLPLCAIPIVIHLLNRRRYQRVPWAAMEYLLAAMKRNRKRLRMEQWLVLLLRTLAVLLLVLLVGRPQLGGGTLLGARNHHVVVLDDSASMTQRTGSTTLFEKAQERVRQLVEQLAERRSGDLLSIVRTSRLAQPDLWGQRIGADIGRRVGSMLKEWTVGDGAPDLGLVLQASVKRAAEVREASRTRYYVVGDRRAVDWAGEDDRPRPSMLQALASMGAEDHLEVMGVGGQPPNLALVDVRLLDRLAVAGVPVSLAVDVQNFGLDPTAPTTVSVEVDGQSRVVQAVPSLLPGERIAVPIGHTFHETGFHAVVAQLEATEQFPLDDRRTLALDIREKSRVLLVDGQPDEEQGEAFFLQAAMEMTESGIEPHVVTDATLEETELQPFDFVWLCNVQAPTPATAARLEAFVAAGGGLAIACGAQVDAQRYNQLFWRDGKGPLPLPLGEIAGDPDRPEGAVLVAKEHPICGRVADVLELLFGNVVLVKRWFTIEENSAHAAAVVARIRDAEGPPLLVTKTFGSGGEVALFAITADTFWSNLPSTDLFVVVVNQLHRAGARRADPSGHNLLTDGVYKLRLDEGTYRPDVSLQSPSGDEQTLTATEQKATEQKSTEPKPADAAAATPPPLALDLAMHDLRQLGAYAVGLIRHDGVPEKRLFARNPPPVESRLLGFSDDAFTRAYPPEVQSRVTFVREDGGLGGDEGEGELWLLLATALLAAILLESVFAWRFGRR